jgi:hypothetical protein
MKRIAQGLVIAGLAATATLPMAAAASASEDSAAATAKPYTVHTVGPFDTPQECRQTASNYARYYTVSQCWALTFTFYFTYLD